MGNQSEAKLSALIESTNDLIWSVDLDFRLTAFNRALRENIECNYGGRVAVGLHSPDYLPPEKAALWPPFYNRALREGAFRVEYRLRDGRFLELAFNPIFAEGKAVGVSVFGKDITERKSAEDSKALLASIVESSDDSIHSIQLDGTIVSWNRASEGMFGYSAQEIIGKNITVLIPLRNRGELAKTSDAIKRGDRVRSFDAVVVHKDGSELDVSLSISPIRNACGDITGACTIARDIRQRKRVEDNLVESESMFRGITETSPLAIVLTEGLDERVEYMNPAFTRIFGYTREDIRTAADWWPLAYPDLEYRKWAMEEWQRRVEHAIETRSAIEPMEVVVACKDGAKKFIQWGFVCIGERNLSHGLDLTEHKRVETALTSSEKLFRAITESSPLAIVLVSAADERVEYLNPTFTRLFGYTQEDMPTTAEWMALAYPDPEYQKWVIGEWQRKVPRSIDPGSEIEPMESVVVCKDGSRKDIAWGFVNLGDRNLTYALDLTERKRAMKQLSESETRFRQFFEINGSVMLLVEPVEGRIMAANRAAAAFYGYSQEQLCAMFSRQISTSTPEEIRLDRQRALRKEQNFFSYRHRLASGEIRDVEMYSSPYEVDGKFLLYAIVHDVSERKQAEEQLRESEARFRRFFEENGSVMLLAEPNSGQIVAANRAAAAFYGYSQDQLTRMHTHELNAMPSENCALDRLRSLHGEGSFFNYRQRLASGEFRDVELYSTPYEMDGRSLLFAIVHDVSERKRTEDALREREESLRESQAIAGLGSYLGDLATGLWHFSEVLKNLMGIDEQYAYTIEAWASLVHPDDRDSMAAYFAEEVLGKGKTFDKEYRIVRQTDGEVRWVHGLGRLDFDAQDNPIRLRGTIQDITERKLAENKLRDSEERYRSTFEQAAVGILHTSFEGHILRCNARFAEIVGYAQQEVQGLTFQQLTVPEDLDGSVEVLQRMVMGAQETAGWEKRYRRKDGTPTWVKMAISTQRDSEGRPLHFVALVEDINALKVAEESLVRTQESLRVSEQRYRTAFQTSMDGICISRMNDGVYIDANKAFLEIMGIELEELVGRSSTELGFWVNAGERAEVVDKIHRDSNFREFETQYKRKDGVTVWVLISPSIIEIEGVQCILSVMRDITASKAAQQRLDLALEALRASEARYRTAFHTSHDGVAINRMSDGFYIDINQAFLDITGFEREEVIGRNSLDLGVWADGKDRKKMIELLRMNPTMRDFDAQFKKKDGQVFWGLMSASIIEIDGVSCILSITRDISDAKVAEEAIRSLAFYDPLTALPNRRLLLERLQQSLASSSRNCRMRALLFVDLDNFKTLNDTLGHPVGDLLLQETARRLTICVRDADTVARLGGDEFVVMLDDLSTVPDLAASQAKAVGEKILAVIGQPYLLAGNDCRSTASIGVAVFGDRAATTEEVLQQADIAMYQAKATGRNTMRFFATALQTAVHARATLEKDLRTAIKAEEFVLYYQPQVDRGRITGAEALVRWKHPERGLLMPGEFIALAEETGLILPLGTWVLESACCQIAAWTARNEATSIALAVNISARQLHQPDFVDQVLAVLDRTGASPHKLKLELTESMLIENVEEIIEKMTELRSHGLRFSLDDFGTGYSSLSYLKRLPLEQLKIDRSFVRDILVDASSGAIAQTIVALGQAMGLPVIAEGVETEAQREFLERMGCHSYQGYLFSRPLPLAEFELLLPEGSEEIPHPVQIS